LVERLALQDKILKEDEEKMPDLQDVNGQEVRSLGIIHLSWKWKSSSPVSDVKCHVLKADHFDILFGVQYITALGMVKDNISIIAPLIPHTKITPC